mgnify:CR=1 FL=1
MNKVTGRFFAPCRNVKRRSRHPVCRVSFCVFVWSLARRSSHRLCRPEAARRQKGWKDRQKTAWIPLRSGRFEIQEKLPRDRGKGLSPAPGQRVRTGSAGTAHSRSAAGAGQRTLAAASDLSAAAAEFSGLVFTATIADGRAHAPRGIVLTEAKVKRDRFQAAPQNGRRRKAFSPFKSLHSVERKRKRNFLPTGEVRPSEHDTDF